MENTEIFRLAEPQYLAFAGITAYQLYLWYESRKFCGCCGSPLRHDEKERMMYCDHCHAMEFPKISPAVIIGLTHKNRLLLSKYAGRTYKKYALLAGYTEILPMITRKELSVKIFMPLTCLKLPGRLIFRQDSMQAKLPRPGQ